jgi:hypothetical protein
VYRCHKIYFDYASFFTAFLYNFCSASLLLTNPFKVLPPALLYNNIFSPIVFLSLPFISLARLPAPQLYVNDTKAECWLLFNLRCAQYLLTIASKRATSFSRRFKASSSVNDP